MIIPIALSFIPLVAVYLCFALLVKDFKKLVGILSCLLGLLAFIPIMGIDLIKDKIIDGSQFSQLVKFLGLALVEEGVKMLLLFFIPSKKTAQGAFFAYSVLLGMTLGCFETLLYIAVLHAKLRWPAILVHAICAGLSGIFVYSVKKKNVLITSFTSSLLITNNPNINNPYFTHSLLSDNWISPTAYSYRFPGFRLSWLSIIFCCSLPETEIALFSLES